MGNLCEDKESDPIVYKTKGKRIDANMRFFVLIQIRMTDNESVKSSNFFPSPHKTQINSITGIVQFIRRLQQWIRNGASPISRLFKDWVEAPLAMFTW